MKLRYDNKNNFFSGFRSENRFINICAGGIIPMAEVAWPLKSEENRFKFTLCAVLALSPSSSGLVWAGEPGLWHFLVTSDHPLFTELFRLCHLHRTQWTSLHPQLLALCGSPHLQIPAPPFAVGQQSPAQLGLRSFTANSKLLFKVFFSGKNYSIPKRNSRAIKRYYFTLIRWGPLACEE